MTSFTVKIGDVLCNAKGTAITDVNPRNGMDYTVLTVHELTIGDDATNVAQFVQPKDESIRDAEIEQFEQEYEGKWAKDLAGWKQKNPDATDTDVAAYREHRESLGESRRMRRRRTNGLHATIEMGGRKMNAYYMRESKPGQPKFRTFVPKDISTRAEAPVSPF